MKQFIAAATAISLALAVSACNRNTGEKQNDIGDTPPVNAAQDAAAGAVGMASSVTAPTTADGYITAAAMGDMYEIEAGKIAQQKAQKPDVKAFAQMIVTDHTAMSNEMKAALPGAGVNVTPPTELDERRKGMLDNLRAASAETFDGAFLHQQLAAHMEALNIHKGYADNGDNAALKALAAKAAPKIQHHLDEVKRIGGDALEQAAPGGQH